MPFNSSVNVGGSALFRSLQQRIPGYIKERRAELLFDGGIIVPYLGDLPNIGNRTLIQGKVLEYGEAVISAPGTYDAPLAEVSVAEDEYRIFKSEIGFRIGYDEMAQFDAMAANGYSFGGVYQLKFDAAIRAIREKLDRTIAYGVPQLGVRGHLNNADVPEDNEVFNPFDDSVDGVTLFDFMISAKARINRDTNAVEGSRATTYEVSPELYSLLERRFLGTALNPGMTVLEKMQAMGRTVIETPRLALSELEANGVFAPGTNQERFVIHPRDPEVTGRMGFFPQLYPENMAKQEGNSTIYMMHGYTSETLVRRPLAMRYVNYQAA